MKSIPRSFVKIDNYKYKSKRWTWINKIKIPTTTVLMFREFHQMWQAQFYLLVASTSIKSLHNAICLPQTASKETSTYIFLPHFF